MGDWTGTVPLFAAGAKLRGVDMQTMADINSALTGPLTTWSPTYANLTSTTATIVSKYRRTGKWIDVYWKFVLGASSAVGTAPSFTLPVAASADYLAAAGAYVPDSLVDLQDISASAIAIGRLTLSSTTVAVMVYRSGALTQANITATAPWTWATGDWLIAWLHYYSD